MGEDAAVVGIELVEKGGDALREELYGGRRVQGQSGQGRGSGGTEERTASRRCHGVLAGGGGAGCGHATVVDAETAAADGQRVILAPGQQGCERGKREEQDERDGEKTPHLSACYRIFGGLGLMGINMGVDLGLVS